MSFFLDNVSKVWEIKELIWGPLFGPKLGLTWAPSGGSFRDRFGTIWGHLLGVVLGQFWDRLGALRGKMFGAELVADGSAAATPLVCVVEALCRCASLLLSAYGSVPKLWGAPGLAEVWGNHIHAREGRTNLNALPVPYQSRF